MLRFSFWGSGAVYYGNELLELACRFLLEYPEPLKTAILNNYLINPSGIPGRWQEWDFYQEHSNKAIKTVFNTENSEWDSRFLRDAVSVNVEGLARLRDKMMEFLGLGRTGRGRVRPDYMADINVLASHYLRGQVFQLRPGRQQECLAQDIFEKGHTKLYSGALNQFLDQTALSRAGQSITGGEPEGAEPEVEELFDDREVEIPRQPLIIAEGELIEHELTDEE